MAADHVIETAVSFVNFFSSIVLSKVLAKDSKEFSLIDEYVKNTHAETHKQYELNILEVIEAISFLIFK